MKKTKYMFSIYAGATPDSKNSEYWDGDIVWITPADYKTTDKYISCGAKSLTKAGYNASNTTIVPAGSIIVSKRAPIGTVSIAEVPLCTNQGCLSCVPNDDVDSSFAYYALSSMSDEMQVLGAGTTFKEISANAFANMKIPYFPLPEQHVIVRYLDAKCSSIDEAIERHKKIVEKLEEYRKALVTYIVTHGLNNDAPTKNSGVRWIDTVPAHWNVCRSKYVFESGEFGIKVGPFGSALRGKMLGEGPYKVYNQAHLINNDFTLSRHFVSAETFDELSSYKIEAGDILFSVMGTIGKCKHMPDGLQQGIMDSHLIKARLNNKLIPAFFEYVYDKDNSNVVMNQLLYLSQGSIMSGLNSTIISNLYLPVPPVNEQKEIVLWLDERCGVIDNAITCQKELMKKLEEYRKSIIYNAVTGKIDCRTEAVE